LVVIWQPFIFDFVIRYMKQLSVTEYAKKEGISRQAALKRIKAGSVDAQKIGNNYIITIKAMKNLIILLAMTIIFCSCKKHKEDPISKEAILHIEYSAKAPAYPDPYQSKVIVYFQDKGPVESYSLTDKENIISKDISIQGGQHVIINGFVIDPTGNCGCASIQSTLKLTYNGHVISADSVGSVQYTGTLEFIN
jgi:hypothetical protein